VNSSVSKYHLLCLISQFYHEDDCSLSFHTNGLLIQIECESWHQDEINCEFLEGSTVEVGWVWADENQLEKSKQLLKLSLVSIFGFLIWSDRAKNFSPQIIAFLLEIATSKSLTLGWDDLMMRKFLEFERRNWHQHRYSRVFGDSCCDCYSPPKLAMRIYHKEICHSNEPSGLCFKIDLNRTANWMRKIKLIPTHFEYCATISFPHFRRCWRIGYLWFCESNEFSQQSDTRTDSIEFCIFSFFHLFVLLCDSVHNNFQELLRGKW
jgi:hypothetical protein